MPYTHHALPTLCPPHTMPSPHYALPTPCPPHTMPYTHPFLPTLCPSPHHALPTPCSPHIMPSPHHALHTSFPPHILPSPHHALPTPCPPHIMPSPHYALPTPCPTHILSSPHYDLPTACTHTSCPQHIINSPHVFMLRLKYSSWQHADPFARLSERHTLQRRVVADGSIAEPREQGRRLPTPQSERPDRMSLGHVHRRRRHHLSLWTHLCRPLEARRVPVRYLKNYFHFMTISFYQVQI